MIDKSSPTEHDAKCGSSDGTFNRWNNTCPSSFAAVSARVFRNLEAAPLQRSGAFLIDLID